MVEEQEAKTEHVLLVSSLYHHDISIRRRPRDSFPVLNKYMYQANKRSILLRNLCSVDLNWLSKPFLWLLYALRSFGQSLVRCRRDDQSRLA